jgi:alpha-L-fucosidase
VNYLLGIGPKSDGELSDDQYAHMANLGKWMKANGPSVHNAKPLPASESANVPATASGSKRYLFAIPKFNSDGTADDDMLPPTDQILSLKGIAGKPSSVRLMGDASELKFDSSDGVVNVQLPAAKRSKLVDVVEIDLQASGAAL